MSRAAVTRRRPGCSRLEIRDAPVLGVAASRAEVGSQVLPGSADEAVGALPAGEPVRPASPVQGVVARTTGQGVGAVAAAQQVIAGRPVQPVGAVLPEQDVGSLVSVQAVGAVGGDAHGDRHRARELTAAEPVDGDDRRARAAVDRADRDRAIQAAAPERDGAGGASRTRANSRPTRAPSRWTSVTSTATRYRGPAGRAVRVR
jgi:hypothetical protein